MSGPEDVLAVMDKANFVLSAKGVDLLADRLSLASAAVAELIEADMEYDKAEIAMNRESGYSDAHIAAIRAFRAASERRRAALARCRGEA